MPRRFEAGPVLATSVIFPAVSILLILPICSVNQRLPPEEPAGRVHLADPVGALFGEPEIAVRSQGDAFRRAPHGEFLERPAEVHLSDLARSLFREPELSVRHDNAVRGAPGRERDFAQQVSIAVHLRDLARVLLDEPDVSVRAGDDALRLTEDLRELLDGEGLSGQEARGAEQEDRGKPRPGARLHGHHSRGERILAHLRA